MVRQVRGKSVAAWRLTRTDAAAGGPAVLTAQETCQAPSEWFINDSSQRLKNSIPRIWNACALKFFEPKNGWLDFQMWFQFRGPLTANRRFWGIAKCPYIKFTLFPLLFFLPFFSNPHDLFPWFLYVVLRPFFTDLSCEEHNEVKLLACLSKLLYLTWWTMLVRLPPTFSGRPIFSAKKCSLVWNFCWAHKLGPYVSQELDSSWAVLNSGVSPLFEKACYEVGPVISIKTIWKPG